LPGPHGPDDPVFLGVRGGRLERHGLAEQFNIGRRAVRLPGLRPHDIRHSIAIRLADKGYDLATIGAILGHKPPYRATLIYTQHTSERRQRLALEQVFQQKSQRPSSDS
jgi:integrase/recombinase XerC